MTHPLFRDTALQFLSTMSVRSWTPLHVALTGAAIFCLGAWIVLWMLHMIAIVYG